VWHFAAALLGTHEDRRPSIASEVAMSTHTHSLAASESHAFAAESAYPAYQAFRALQIVFVIAPLAAGADKFFNWLTNWEQYLAPVAARIAPPATFMHVVGVIEIVAALLVATKPRIGAYIVAIWMLGIVVNLLVLGSFYDIALRDFGLAIGAFALGRLADEFAAARRPMIA
jgi:uncharacterized membrane protein YphA (DoxX/SURF4 family)